MRLFWNKTMIEVGQRYISEFSDFTILDHVENMFIIFFHERRYYYNQTELEKLIKDGGFRLDKSRIFNKNLNDIIDNN